VNVLGPDGTVRKQYPSQLTYKPSVAVQQPLAKRPLQSPPPLLQEQRVEQQHPSDMPFRTGGNKFSVIYIDSKLLTFISAESFATVERLKAVQTAESDSGHYKLF
jgi:hypothetical protein